MRTCATKCPRRIVDCVLWGAVGAMGLFMIVAALAHWPNNWPGVVVGVVFLSLTVCAVVRHWGPMIPCMFVGMVSLSLLTSPISSSHEEAAFKDIGVPLFGAVIGAAVGIKWARARGASLDHCLNCASPEGHGINEERSQAPDRVPGPEANG